MEVLYFKLNCFFLYESYSKKNNTLTSNDLSYLNLMRRLTHYDYVHSHPRQLQHDS